MFAGKPSKFIRVAAAVLVLLLLAAVLLSSFYVAREVAHSCHQEKCAVCAAIATCEKTLRQFSNGLALCVLFCFFAVLLSVAAAFTAEVTFQQTPVTQKVRLDN